MEGLIDISEREFQDLAKLVYRVVGIHLTDKKKMLVRGRLNKVIRKLGYTSFDQYYHALENDTTGTAISELIDRISTNHTYFFREEDHFHFLKDEALPWITEKLEGSGGRDVRIWCAGCASGEEAYTLAIVLAESLGMDFFTGGPPILATDISNTALNAALVGSYPAERLKEVSKPLLSKYFTAIGSGRYQVKDTLKKLVLFKRFNFQNPRFPFKKQFHLIFCRNVMIYFDVPTKDTLIAKFEAHLLPGGYFFIGHSETLGRNHPVFRYIKPALYRKGDSND
jgi:chemotaxis protein methyltransferase CheR